MLTRLNNTPKEFTETTKQESLDEVNEQLMRKYRGSLLEQSYEEQYEELIASEGGKVDSPYERLLDEYMLNLAYIKGLEERHKQDKEEITILKDLLREKYYGK